MEVREISLDEIVEPRQELRSYAREENLNELAQSIKARGVIEPIIVTPRGKKYEIIAGWRRWKASQLAGKATIPAIVRQDKEMDREAIRIQENLIREDIDHLSIARYLRYLQKKYNYTIRDLARLCNKSVAWVHQHLMILEYDPLIREAVKDGMINWTVARHLDAISDQTTRHLYLREAISRGANSETVRQWKENWQKQQKIISKTTEERKAERVLEPPPPFVWKCWNCGREVETQQTTTIRLCPVCAQALQDAKFREEKKQ